MVSIVEFCLLSVALSLSVTKTEVSSRSVSGQFVAFILGYAYVLQCPIPVFLAGDVDAGAEPRQEGPHDGGWASEPYMATERLYQLRHRQNPHFLRYSHVGGPLLRGRRG